MAVLCCGGHFADIESLPINAKLLSDDCYPMIKHFDSDGSDLFQDALSASMRRKQRVTAMQCQPSTNVRLLGSFLWRHFSFLLT